jgi:phenylpyruvate tautomerase
MPVLSITTNSEPRVSPELLARMSSAVAEMLGKPESYVMLLLQHQRHMLFAGSDAPLAYVELKSIALPVERTAEFSARLCELIATELGTPRERIYIEFSDLQRNLFGWNAQTF